MIITQMRFIFTSSAFPVLLIAALALQSCSSDDDSPTDPGIPLGVADVEMNLAQVWGEEHTPFEIGAPYQNIITGDTLTFTTLNYYISNVVLHRTDGSSWTEEESYHLVRMEENAAPSSTTLLLKDVPSGAYSSMTYLIGVDSLRNTRGAQEGALDPVHLMFWGWNTGYIFVKAEGQTGGDQPMGFAYHLGGFAGPHNALRQNTHTFDGATLQVLPDEHPSVHFKVRVDLLWNDGVPVAERPFVHSAGANASALATNFAGGITFDHIHQ